MGDSYYVDTAEWARRTGHLSLKQEGAYLRLCNAVHANRTAIIIGRRHFQSIWACGNAQAASLLRQLAAAGMVEMLGDWHVRVLKTRLHRTSLNAAIRALVLARDGYVCRYCGTEEAPFDVDHVHPVALGGSDDPENLCVACVPCNRSKGARTVAEWRGVSS